MTSIFNLFLNCSSCCFSQWRLLLFFIHTLFNNRSNFGLRPVVRIIIFRWQTIWILNTRWIILTYRSSKVVWIVWIGHNIEHHFVLKMVVFADSRFLFLFVLKNILDAVWRHWTQIYFSKQILHVIVTSVYVAVKT